MPEKHRIPTNINPTGDIIVPLIIPHDPQWSGLLLGVLTTLEVVEYYQRDPDFDDEDAKTVAAQWRDRTINPLIDAIANGEGCGTVNHPVGSAIQFFGSSAPEGWMLCDGAAISRTTYAALFAVIGTTYGAGDGSSTFNLPDMRGRAGVGAGTGSGLTNRALGSNFGAETHQLTSSEMPVHSHNRNVSGFEEQTLRTGTGGIRAFAGGSQQVVTATVTASAGGDAAHNNMQPSLAVNFIIKY